MKYFAKSGLVQPWDTKLIPNFKHLNPCMVKAGQYKGKQYGIPADWGFDAILYRTDKVKPKSDSFSLLFDERYKGKITWYDDGVEMFALVGYLFGYKEPYNQTDAQLKRNEGLPDLEEEVRPQHLVERGQHEHGPSRRATSGSRTPGLLTTGT